MFEEMRRADRELDSARTEEVLRRGVYGVLSVSGRNGYAYGVPLNYTYTDGSIYFHSAAEGRKLSDIAANERVSFCVVGQTQVLPDIFAMRYESVIVFGRATEARDEEKMKALMALVAKYAPENMEKGKAYAQSAFDETKVIKIAIDRITGKGRK